MNDERRKINGKMNDYSLLKEQIMEYSSQFLEVDERITPRDKYSV